MVTIQRLEDNIKSYIFTQIDNMSKSNPAIKFIKPVISRVIDNNIDKITGFLNIIADKNGNIDVDGIITEIIDNIKTTESFSFNIPIIGNIEIGDSMCKMNIPLLNKKLILNTEDLNTLKEMLLI